MDPDVLKDRIGIHQLNEYGSVSRSATLLYTRCDNFFDSLYYFVLPVRIIIRIFSDWSLRTHLLWAVFAATGTQESHEHALPALSDKNRLLQTSSGKYYSDADPAGSDIIWPSGSGYIIITFFRILPRTLSFYTSKQWNVLAFQTKCLVNMHYALQTLLSQFKLILVQFQYGHILTYPIFRSMDPKPKDPDPYLRHL